MDSHPEMRRRLRAITAHLSSATSISSAVVTPSEPDRPRLRELVSSGPGLGKTWALERMAARRRASGDRPLVRLDRNGSISRID